MKCQICNQPIKDLRGLCAHLLAKHKDYCDNHFQKYYDSFFLKKSNKCPLCNNKKEFKSLAYGYKLGCTEHKHKINALNTWKKRRISGKTTSYNKGKKQSPEQIEKRKRGFLKFLNSDKGLQWRQKMSKRQLGQNNTCHKISQEKLEQMHKQMSILMKEKIKNGTFTPCITNSWANSQTKLIVNGFSKYYRSTWEAVFQILNPTCVYETTRIQYIDEHNEEHVYIIDFTDNINKILYEIKPDRLKMNIKNLLKAKYAILWCKKNGYQYKMITNEYFQKNAKLIDYSKYDSKIYDGMKQFL